MSDVSIIRPSFLDPPSPAAVRECERLGLALSGIPTVTWADVHLASDLLRGKLYLNPYEIQQKINLIQEIIEFWNTYNQSAEKG